MQVFRSSLRSVFEGSICGHHSEVPAADALWLRSKATKHILQWGWLHQAACATGTQTAVTVHPSHGAFNSQGYCAPTQAIHGAFRIDIRGDLEPNALACFRQPTHAREVVNVQSALLVVADEEGEPDLQLAKVQE